MTISAEKHNIGIRLFSEDSFKIPAKLRGRAIAIRAFNGAAPEGTRHRASDFDHIGNWCI
jgi:hypothetical protein